MAKTRSYQKDLLEALQDPDEAIEYLNAALEDGEPEVFLLALKDVVDSHGGMSKISSIHISQPGKSLPDAFKQRQSRT